MGYQNQVKAPRLAKFPLEIIRRQEGVSGNFTLTVRQTPVCARVVLFRRPGPLACNRACGGKLARIPKGHRLRLISRNEASIE
jgi:hypothetical protein